MSRRWFAAVLLSVMVFAPATARASGGWTWPVDGQVQLPYGAAYGAASGHTSTHSGLDIAAPAGSDVRACGPGEVSFAGLVPAGEGERAWAVTVATADGLRVTYLPMTSVRVHRGQTVSAAQDLGTLAGSGDASGGSSHLHLGVKRGSASLDPLTLLAAKAAAAPATAPNVPAAAHGVAGSGAGKPVPARTVGAPGEAPVTGGARVTAGAATPAYGSAKASQADAVAGALAALAVTPSMTRVEPVASPPMLDLAKARADLLAKKGSVLAVATPLGLLLLAAGCAWPVMRAARDAGSKAVPVPVRRAHE